MLVDAFRDSTGRGGPISPFPPIFMHFWLLFGAIMLLNVAYWRRASRRYVAAGWYTDEEAGRFFRNVALWLVGYALLAELFVLWVGTADFFCAMFHPGSRARLVGLTVNLAIWALLLRWVWLGRGGETLARFAPVTRRSTGLAERPYDVRIVRGVVTLMVLVSLASSAVMLSGRMMPPGSCPAVRSAD